MLDFYSGTGGFDNPGEHLGEIDLDEISWLQKNKLIPEGKTGHFPDDPPESLPYFDDVILSHEQVSNIYKHFKERVEELSKTPGFKSNAIEKMDKILSSAMEMKIGLSTIAD